jgi:hypothetical protein
LPKIGGHFLLDKAIKKCQNKYNQLVFSAKKEMANEHAQPVGIGRYQMAAHMQKQTVQNDGAMKKASRGTIELIKEDN